MKYHQQGSKGILITDKVSDRIKSHGGSNLLRAFWWYLKQAERQYCTPKRDCFSWSDNQVMCEMGITKPTVTKLKRELVSLGLAKTWQAKLPAGRSGRKMRKATPHITYYRLLY